MPSTEHAQERLGRREPSGGFPFCSSLASEVGTQPHTPRLGQAGDGAGPVARSPPGLPPSLLAWHPGPSAEQEPTYGQIHGATLAL